MNIRSDFETGCTRMIAASVSDGQGGQHTTWSDGTSFTAEIYPGTPSEAERADKNTLRGGYTIYTEKAVVLNYGDVFRRDSDGQIFRVTSNSRDGQTPGWFKYSFARVTAEEWRLT